MAGNTARYSRRQSNKPRITLVDEVAGTTHWDLDMTPTETTALHRRSASSDLGIWTRRGTTIIGSTQPRRSLTVIEPPRPAVTQNNYSDLPEVVEAIPPSWDMSADDKMPVIVDESSEKIAAVEGQIPASMLSPSLEDPVPAYPHSLRSQRSNLSTMALTGERSLPNSPYYDRWQARDEVSRDVKVCGMGSRVFMYVTTGLLVFVLVLLATVLGVTLTMKGQKSLPSSSASTGNVTILDTTQLAAVNWTDATGVARSAVFYQGFDSSIIVSLHDSVSNKWYYSNVTQAILNVTGAGAFDVLAGTPLAAVTNSNQVSLYYMTNDYFVSEIWSSDIVGQQWFAGQLGIRLPTMAMPGSKISAFWQICDNCTNSLFVAYQDPTGFIQLCNMTSFTWSFAGPVGSRLSANGTGLAIRPFTDNDGRGLYGTTDNALRVYHSDPSGKLLEAMRGPETNFTWVDSTSTVSNAAAMMNPSPASLAAESYGDHGWTNMMVAYHTSDKALTASFWNGSAWATGKPSISGGPQGLTNFSAIATSQNELIYGFANGGVYEFVFDASDPLNWIHTYDVVTGRRDETD